MAVSPKGWTVRVRGARENIASAVVHGTTLLVGPALDFDERHTVPSAFEVMLAAFGADVLNGFTARCERARLKLYSTEIAVQGNVENPLVFLDVIGEGGSPRLEKIEATLYVTAQAENDALTEVWNRTLERSPLYSTLSRCATIEMRLVIM